MRIVHLIQSLGGGGAERQLAYLAAQHARRGHDVHIIAHRGGPNAGGLDEAGVKLHWLKRGHHDPRILNDIYQLIRAIRPDIIQTWLTQMDVVGALIARATRIPHVMTERSCADAYPSTIKNRLRIMAGRNADAIIANSAGGVEYWQSVPRVRAHLELIHNAVDLDAIHAAAPLRPDGVAENEKFVLYAGRLDRDKNFDALLNALRAASSVTSARFVICGDGTGRSRLEGEIREGPLAGRVICLGYRKDVWRLMKTADLFLSLSSYEGHPNAVLEAMACECPLLLSDIPAHRAFLDERSSWFVDPTAAESVASLINHALGEPAQARKHAREARMRVGRFSIAASADRYEHIYALLS